MSTQNKIIVILGPTSSGKSDIAIKLAKKFNGEIISADSRQVFRGMDIGTGKIKGRYDARKKTYVSAGIPHYMIDIVSPRTDYNITKFKRRAENIMWNILERGKVPIICGGTGFWIKAVVDNITFPEVKPDWKLRKKIEKYSAERLISMLIKLDPKRAENIDAKNKVRLIRAIEICKILKKVPDIKRDSRTKNFKFLQIGLRLPKEKLHANIEKRVKLRFKQGMIKEIANLHAAGLSWKKIQTFGLAYSWIPFYLQNKITKEELCEKVIQAEKNYAKRQMTWFQGDKRIIWLHGYRDIEKAAREFLKR